MKIKMKKETMIKFALIIALIIIIGITVLLINKTDTVMTQTGKFYQYYAGIKTEYEGTIHLNKEERYFNSNSWR